MKKNWLEKLTSTYRSIFTHFCTLAPTGYYLPKFGINTSVDRVDLGTVAQDRNQKRLELNTETDWLNISTKNESTTFFDIGLGQTLNDTKGSCRNVCTLCSKRF